MSFSILHIRFLVPFIFPQYVHRHCNVDKVVDSSSPVFFYLLFFLSNSEITFYCIIFSFNNCKFNYFSISLKFNVSFFSNNFINFLASYFIPIPVWDLPFFMNSSVFFVFSFSSSFLFSSSTIYKVGIASSPSSPFSWMKSISSKFQFFEASAEASN